MARSRWNGDDGTTHAEAWSARESRRVPVAFRSSTTSRPRRGRGKRRASHAAAPARPPMCNAGGRRGSLGLPNAGGFWGNKGVRSRLSFSHGLSATLDASRTRQAAVHARDAQKNTFITRARTRVSHPTNIAFSARHDPPRGCVFRPPRRGGGENITLAKKNTRLVTRPPPRWLFRGGTPPRSCTGTWRARRRPPPRRWRRSR